MDAVVLQAPATATSPVFPPPRRVQEGKHRNTPAAWPKGASLASAEALEQFSGSRQRNESSAPARPVGGVVMEGAQAVAARSPALRAPQTWTRWTVESLEPMECGIPAKSNPHQPRRLRALHPDRSQEEEEKRQAWPPGRHREPPCAEYLAHILQNPEYIR